MREIAYSPGFLRDIKRLKRKHYDMAKLVEAEKALRVADHQRLVGEFRDCRFSVPCAGRWWVRLWACVKVFFYR